MAGCKDGADIHGGRGLEEEDEFLPSAGASTVGKRRRVEERVRFLFFMEPGSMEGTGFSMERVHNDSRSDLAFFF